MNEPSFFDFAHEIAGLREYAKTARKLLEGTRAGRLLAMGTPFLAVRIDEPYAKQVALLIRDEEVRKETWTNEDETRFVEYFGKLWFDEETQQNLFDTPCFNKEEKRNGNQAR